MRTLQTLAFLILVGAPWWAAWTLVRRAGERSLLWRHCAALVLTAAWIVLCASVLGALHALAPGPALVLSLPLLPCAWFWRQRSATRPVPRRAFRSIAVRLAVLAAATVFVILFARGLTRPMLDWDSLSYHLARSAHWLQEGTLAAVPIPDAMTSYNRFPWNGALLGTWLMLPFHDDSVVGLVNLPFLLLTGMALAGIGRELGVRPATRALLALHACMSPMLVAWVSTAGVDNQLAGEVAAGVWFLLRAWRRGTRADTVLMFVAFGLAVGTKLTALVPAGVAIAALFFRDVGRRRAGGWLPGIALFVALAAPRYVLNAFETGNPLYPVQTTLLGLHLDGSPFDERAIREWGPRDPAREREGIANLFRWCAPNGLCAGPGPAMLGFVLLALTLPLWPRRRMGRGLALVLTLSWVLPVLAFHLDSSPTTLQVRRAFPDHAPRYHAASLVLASVFALAALPRWPLLRALVNGLLVASALYGLRFLDAGFLHPWAEFALAIAPFAFALALAFVLVRLPGMTTRIVATAVAVTGLGAWSSLLQRQREHTRHEYFAWQRPGGSPLPITAGAWQHCDRPDRPQRIALAIGWWPGGMSWCLYPFYGSRLQNRVFWVPADRPWPYDAATDNGAERAPGDFELWRRNLRAAQVDAIYLQLPEGEELRWTREHADRFAVEYAGVGHGVLRPVW